MTGLDDPRRSVPRELAPLLRMEVSPVSVSIFEAIEKSIPEYSQFRDNVVDGIRQALVKFVDRIAEPDSAGDPHDDIHRKLGAWEFKSGRSLDSLQAAYRIGARVAWRQERTIPGRGSKDSRSVPRWRFTRSSTWATPRPSLPMAFYARTRPAASSSPV